jgi:hypothetical protein
MSIYCYGPYEEKRRQYEFAMGLLAHFALQKVQQNFRTKETQAEQGRGQVGCTNHSYCPFSFLFELG